MFTGVDIMFAMFDVICAVFAVMFVGFDITLARCVVMFVFGVS